MKRPSTFLLALASMIILASAIVALPSHTPVQADGATLTVSPSSGVYLSRSVTVIGASYAAKETVKVYWNYTGPGTGILEATAKTDAAGAFTARFKMPLAATNTYTIAGIGQTSMLVATGTFLLLPRLLVSPPQGIAGTQLTISGDAFGDGEMVNLYWNYAGPGTGTLLTTATGDNTGSFSINAHVPSNADSGVIAIVGIGQTSNTSAKFSFTIYVPTLALAPLQGSANSSLTLSAFGFQPLENVNIFWNNSMTPVLTGTTNQFGYLAPTVIIVPAVAPGSYPINAVGQNSQVSIANAFEVVAPDSALRPTTGTAATNVNVSGQGYTPGESVNIIWNYTGPGTGSTVATSNAGPSGTVEASFIVPSSTNGPYTVAVLGMNSNSTSLNTFTLGNGLVASPATTPPGTKVTVTGTGFQPGESVAVHWNTLSGEVLTTTTADTNGNIDHLVTILANAMHGSHNLVAVGLTSGVSFIATVTVETNWGDFGFDNPHHRYNVYEHAVGTTSVAHLKLKWTAATGTDLESSPIYAKGIVYLTTNDGRLMAYDAITGALKWQFNSDTHFPNRSAPLVDPAADIVFFGTIGQVNPGIPSVTYALNAQVGTLEWSLIIPGDEYAFPTLAFDTIYVGSSVEGGPGYLYALDERTGNIDWQYSASGGIWGAAAVDTRTRTVFTGVGNPPDQVVALNATSGASIWQFSVPNSGGDDDVGAGLVVDNGMVYASSKNGSVYAIREKDGTIVWSTPVGALNIGNVSAPALAEGILYVGSLDMYLYALNATTGAVLWKTLTGNSIYSSPAAANGVVYFASLDKNIYALDTTSGTVLWKFTLGAESFSSPILVNGWLYCGASNGILYAFSR
jgi:outer membrane protein assembly factor BamB